MKIQLQWIALMLAGISLIAGSLGCATLAATSQLSNHGDFYAKPILSDEIVALGRPDASLVKAMKQDNVIAFVGKKNTYMLYKGGDELEQISLLKLDGRRMDIDAIRSHNLYLKDKQLWGELILTYGGGNEITSSEKSELERAGFNVIKGVKSNLYQKKITIEGVLYPAIKLSESQMAQLTNSRAFNLYNPSDAKPPANVGAALMIPIAIGVDVVLAPVYLGIGAVVLVASVVQKH